MEKAEYPNINKVLIDNYYFNMSQLSAFKGFYIKAYTMAINNTFKTVYLNRLKDKFHVILLTQTADEETSDRCTNHIAIQIQTRANLIIIYYN